MYMDFTWCMDNMFCVLVLLVVLGFMSAQGIGRIVLCHLRVSLLADMVASTALDAAFACTVNHVLDHEQVPSELGFSVYSCICIQAYDNHGEDEMQHYWDLEIT